MSIHPAYAQAILDGTKTVEFRKKPIADDVTHIVIYVTSPVARVVGVFSVADQITSAPQTLWRRFASVAGISKQKFFEYYEGRSVGTGIRVDSVHPFATNISLTEAFGFQRPPQSYQYLRDADAVRALSLAAAI